MSKVFVSGIGTDAGKTVVSSVLCAALGAEYWKPIQAGDLENTDTHKVTRLSGATAFPERYRLHHPMSPHAAAALENTNIQVADFVLPETNKPLVVEGAGGLLVPINDNGATVLDLAEHLDLPLVLVVSFYLGSINHTLLSLSVLESRGTKVAGLIYSGEINEASREIIEKCCKWPVIGHVPLLSPLNKENVAAAAKQLNTMHLL